MKRVIVTCGPAHAPIDEVRRITNFATGEIGHLLSLGLKECGFDVLCLRGEGATYPPPPEVETLPFSTNESLLDLFRAQAADIHAVFHAAALCDFDVEPIPQKKISSAIPEWQITLRPAVKVLPLLRGMFPDALLVGWKYELEGTRDDVLARAQNQIRTAHTDLCVVNGSAYGEGFGILGRNHPLQELPNKAALSQYLSSVAQRSA